MKQRPHIIPSIIAILFLLGAFGHYPYGYYVLLRFIVCGVAAYVAYISYESKLTWATWVFGIIAFLFNPIIKFHLGRELWQIVDLIAAVLFVIGIFTINKSES